MLRSACSARFRVRAALRKDSSSNEMTLRSNNKRTVEKELSSQVTYGYWGGEAVGLGRLREKTQRELE